MSVSKTNICNQALFHLKNSKTLTDVDTDTSLQASVFLAFYDDVLEEMLREFEWPFAKRIASLALVETDPADGVEWGFSYRWPSDAIKARYIVDGNMDPSVQYPRISFEVGGDDTGRLILTNEEDASLAYTKLVDDVTVMSPKFRKALSLRLAMEAAPTLAGSDQAGMALGQLAERNYRSAMSEAKAEYLNERQSDNPRESEFIEGR
jgi:hypothetical protein